MHEMINCAHCGESHTREKECDPDAVERYEALAKVNRSNAGPVFQRRNRHGRQRDPGYDRNRAMRGRVRDPNRY